MFRTHTPIIRSTGCQVAACGFLHPVCRWVVVLTAAAWVVCPVWKVPWTAPSKPASTCHISTSDIETLPELRGTTQTELHTPKIYLPTKIPIVTDYEIKQLNDVTPTELQKLDDVTTARHTMDTDTVLHIYDASLIQEHKRPWNSVAALYMSIIAILGAIYIHL